jgi:glucose-6-phosphate isomerase
VQSVVYGVNAFDQYGVEHGKKVAQSLSKVISKSSRYTGKNQSTRALLSQIRKYNEV